jgi:hypothetical protein
VKARRRGARAAPPEAHARAWPRLRVQRVARASAPSSGENPSPARDTRFGSAASSSPLPSAIRARLRAEERARHARLSSTPEVCGALLHHPRRNRTCSQLALLWDFTKTGEQ